MVKLCRLVSKNGILQYESSIQSNLTLPRQSKVGLGNVSWEKSLFQYIVNSSNNKITIKFENSSGSDTLTAFLDPDTYDINNFQDLMADIKSKLNDQLLITTPKMVGMSIDVYESTENDMLRIVAYQNQIIDFFRTTSDDDYENVNCEDTGTNVYQRIATGSNLYDSALYGKLDNYFFNSGTGCGILRFKINKMSTTTGSKGAYIGLTNIRPENLGGNYDFQIDKITFGIQFRNSLQTYAYIKTDEAGNTTIGYNKTPTYFGEGDDDNDVIELSMNQGKLTGRLYSNTYIDGFTFFEEVYEGQVLYPILAFSSDNCSVRKLRYTPQIEQEIETYQLLQSSLLGSPKPPQQDLSSSIFTLSFEDITLSSFLGFPTNILINQGLGFKFRGTQVVQFFDNSEAYIVELLNLPIDSFDFSANKQRKRYILQVIQNQRNKQEQDVLYETSSPLMIDLNNNNEILLKNINLRILNSEEQEVNINGVSNLTLIFD